jgi:hypothetical protein
MVDYQNKNPPKGVFVPTRKMGDPFPTNTQLLVSEGRTINLV